MSIVQSVLDMWNVVIIEVRSEEQIFASSSKVGNDLMHTTNM
jgi:hypothetical protein